MEFDYYYNNVPGEPEPSRNNLIYTSLISNDKKLFCQWYYNDKKYHKNQNQVVSPELMSQKWNRELTYLKLMSINYPDLVPKIHKIDEVGQKIFLEIDGPDFWEQAGCLTENFNKVLPNWREQMINIIKAHKSLGLYKYSMHPSSYFVIDGSLKSINYFFTYHKDEGPISIEDHSSHIYETRQKEIRKYTESLNISWSDPQPLDLLEKLCWNSFRTNYPTDFIEQVIECIN